MKSKTCFFNGTLARKDFFRGFPLWLLWLLGWLTAMPLYVLNSNYRTTAMEFSRHILDLASASTHILPMLYAAAVAFLLLSYQYTSRSANFFGALPLKRESLFATKFITGLAYCVLPNLLTALLTLAVGAGKGMDLAAATGTWLAVSCLMYFFFFSFACLCAMMVGHMVAMPVVYGLLLFAAVVLEQIVRAIMEAFVYGFTARGDLVTEWLSPVVKLLNGVSVHSQWDSVNGELSFVFFEGWNVVGIYAAVGVAFLAVAFFFHKYRRMESAGDVIAVRHLKPLYLYGFTFSCAIVLGYVLSAILFDGSDHIGVLRIGLCMVLAAIIGYFGGQMLLHKSLRVFRKQYFINCAVACVLIVALLGCLRFDLFNIAGRVPQAEEVESLSFDWSNMYQIKDQKLIQSVIDVHQEIVDRQEETEEMLKSDGYYYPSVRLTYNLKNGGSFTRTYSLPVTQATVADPNSLVNLYDEMYNDPDMVVARELPDGITDMILLRTIVDAAQFNESWTLNSAETRRLLEEGIIPDLRDGLLGVARLADNVQGYKKDGPADPVAEENWDMYVTVIYRRDSDSRAEESCHLTIYKEAHRTRAILEEYGVSVEMTEKP